MAYVDGFVLPLPRDKVEQYKKLAETAARVWREHGALRVCECIADDVKPGKWTSFPQSVDLKEGEVVVFSWIEYRSRAERDAVNEKVMKDPRLAEHMKPENLPFDGKRMIFGGFERMLEF